MKIKREFLRIGRLPGTVGGAKLEPEQQPAQRVQEVDAQVTAGNGRVGTLRTEIVTEQSASEIANIERAKCFGCRHFRPDDWKKLRRSMESTMEGRRQLNTIRAAILGTSNARLHEVHDNDGETDVEHAIAALGICGPLTEIDGTEPIIVHPLGCCPNEVCTVARPTGLFEAKSQEAERYGTAAYDNIMQTAAGRK